MKMYLCRQENKPYFMERFMNLVHNLYLGSSPQSPFLFFLGCLQMLACFPPNTPWLHAASFCPPGPSYLLERPYHYPSLGSGHISVFPHTKKPSVTSLPYAPQFNMCKCESVNWVSSTLSGEENRTHFILSAVLLLWWCLVHVMGFIKVYRTENSRQMVRASLRTHSEWFEDQQQKGKQKITCGWERDDRSLLQAKQQW